MHGIGVWGHIFFNLFIFQLHPCAQARNHAFGLSEVHVIADAVACTEFALLTFADAGIAIHKLASL